MAILEHLFPDLLIAGGLEAMNMEKLLIIAKVGHQIAAQIQVKLDYTDTIINIGLIICL